MQIKWTRSDAQVVAIIAAALSLYAFAYAAQFWRTLPVLDGWGGVLFLEKLWYAPYHFLVVNQHNDHRIPFVRVLYVIDFSMFKGRATFLYAALVAHILALAGLLGMVVAHKDSKTTAATCGAIALAILTAPLQIANLVNPLHMVWWAVDLFALAALYCAAIAVERRSEIPLIPAMFFAFLAACSAMTGLLIAPAVAVAAGFVSRRAAVIAIGGAGAVMAFYFIGYIPEPRHAQASFTGPRSVVVFAYAICVQLGMMAQQLGFEACAITGAAGVALWLVLAIAFLRRWRRGDFDAAVACLVAFGGMAIVSAALAAFIRLGGGHLGAMMVSRYATNALLFWISSAGVLWRMVDRRPATALLALVLIGAYLPNAQEIEAVRVQAEAATVATDRLRRGDFSEIDTIVPGLDVRAPIDYFRRNHLSIFAD